jgi:PAS domain S-box-containing protein
MATEKGPVRAAAQSSSPLHQKVTEADEAHLLRLLVDNVSDYVIIMLDPTGKVITWSAAAQRLKGWQADEIIGQHFSRFYPPEDVARGKTQIELEGAARDGRFEDEGWRVRKDGTRFWANVVITCLRDSDGQIRGFGKITRDLSERRAAEERIKKQNQEILEMSAVPVVQVWDGIVLVPLIGTLDSQRTQQLMERVLNRVMETSSPVAILDITGVPSIDTQTAQHLIETTAAVRLLGAEVVLTGVRPPIAQTLVHLGIDLSSVTTRSSLTAGLRMALEMINLRVLPATSSTESANP